MSRRVGAGGFAVAAVIGAAVLGCGTRGGRGVRPVDSFGLADANLVVKADLAGLVGSKFHADLTKELRKRPGLASPEEKSIDRTVKETLGLAPSDIETIVVSVNTDDERLVIAAATKAPVDRDAVIAALSEEGPKLQMRETHAGVDLLAPTAEDEMVLAFPAPDLIVVGTKEEVRKGIDRLQAGMSVQVKGKVADLLRAAPEGAGVVVAAVPALSLVPSVVAVARVVGLNELAVKIRSFTLAAKAGEALDVGLAMEFETDEDARDARARIEETVAAFEAKLGDTAAEEGMEPLKELVSGIKVGGAGKSVDVLATVSAGAAKAVLALMGPVKMKTTGRTGGVVPGMSGAP